jgi:hypothetical protein
MNDTPAVLQNATDQGAPFATIEIFNFFVYYTLLLYLSLSCFTKGKILWKSLITLQKNLRNVLWEF